MFSFAPTYLANWTGGRWLSSPVGPLTGFTQDSRHLKPGQVFVALKTDKRDGHDFLETALSAGASAALVSQPNPSLILPQLVVADTLKAFQAIASAHRQQFRGPVVGVTGSCGKTSTKNLLAELLGGAARVLATEGNLNNHLGVPLTLTKIVPGSHDFAVVEAGISAPGEMAELATMIAPDHGIVTLVAHAHTQELGGVDGVAREKAVLLQSLRPGGLGVYPKQCWDFAAFHNLPQTSIVVAPVGAQVKAPRVIEFGVTFTLGGTELLVGKRQFRFRRVSRGMAQNAALAIVLASELGVTDDSIQKALENWQSAKWRGEFRRESGRLLYLDFYNANPASMADALETFFAIAPDNEPRLLVLGCMEELGPDAALHHHQLGHSLKLRPQDRAYVIGGEASAVVEGAVEAGIPRDRIQCVDSLEAVAKEVATFQGAVFVKGSRRYGLEKVLPATSSQPVVANTGGGGTGRGGLEAAFALNRSVSVLPSGWHFPTKMMSRARARRTSHTSFFI
ncbi:MAG: UDP-N-acetylmuramoyl-tripeptide--D-alanyl-D-alanine ligase [Verrucomicrobia bacterium]|nr:UDP-N-acetylmuramoyl-tripeptide--D-alanyl-D-alanine ligase [Verrucomicrobiota bacterium]